MFPPLSPSCEGEMQSRLPRPRRQGTSMHPGEADMDADMPDIEPTDHYGAPFFHEGERNRPYRAPGVDAA